MDLPLRRDPRTLKEKRERKPAAAKKATEAETDHLLRQAFENSLQANLLYTVSHGEILKVNKAACKLLGYSKKLLLTKTTHSIFDVKENHFRELHSREMQKGEYKGNLTVIKKNGTRLICQITSATFFGDHNIKKAIITLEDMSDLEQNHDEEINLREQMRSSSLMQKLAFEKEIEEKVNLEIRLKETQIAEAIVDAKELERSDIGKELHDNVNQLLGASRLYLDMAKRDDDNRDMYLNRSSEYTLTAIEAIRKLTKSLTADIIRNFGLYEAISKICHDTMESNPIKLDCKMDRRLEKKVNDKFKLNIFRIIQEQFNNILKHAKAAHVTVSLSQTKKNILLVVSDDGAGFDTGKKRNGIGLTNIQSRAELYNGGVHFTSSPGKGCVLTVSFPVAGNLLNPGRS